MTEVKNASVEIDLSKYNELEQYMPRQVVLAQLHDRSASAATGEMPAPMKGMEIYESLIASVKTSSMAIRELAHVKQELTVQNQELQSHYEQQLSELREALASEQSRAKSLEIEMKTLKGAYQHRLDECSTRTRELESHNSLQAEKIKKQADQVQKIRGILDYLVGEVAADLDESLRESNVMIHEVNESSK